MDYGEHGLPVLLWISDGRSVRKSGFSLSVHLSLGLVTGFIWKVIILSSFYSVAVVVCVIESPRKTYLEATKTAFPAERKKLFLELEEGKYSELALGSLLSAQGYMGCIEVCMRYRLHKNLY